MTETLKNHIDHFNYEFDQWSVSKRFSIPNEAYPEYQKEKSAFLSDMFGNNGRLVCFMKETGIHHIGQNAHTESYQGKLVEEITYTLDGRKKESCAYKYNQRTLFQRIFTCADDITHSTTHTIHPKSRMIDVRINNTSADTSLSMRFIRFKDKRIGVSSIYLNNYSDAFEKPLISIKDTRHRKLICLNNNLQMAQEAFDRFQGDLPARFAHSDKFLDILLPIQESFDLLRSPKP